DQAGHRLRIDARDRDEATDAIDDQRSDHEQQALPQLGELAHAADATHCAGATTQSRYSSTWPPAASIAARAPAVAAMPLISSFRDTSPLLTILARLAEDGTSFAATRAAKSMVSPLTRASLYSMTSAVSPAFLERKPIFGRRMCMGIWPPSKPAL